MKVALISADSIVAHGIRALSAYLKEHGHDVISIFFARWDLYLRMTHEEFKKKEFQDLKELVLDCDLIGITTNSFNYYHALHLVEILKTLNKPVVMGGIHTNMCPEEVLKHTDIICIGEGEEALVDLLKRMENNENIYDTPNFWFKKDGQIIRNRPRPLIKDVDSLPTPDYSFDRHYIFNGFEIAKLEPKHFNDIIYYYGIYGCPYNCDFCSNLPFYRTITGDETCKSVHVRKKSIEKVIDDIESIASHFPHENLQVTINDDTFFMRSVKEFETLAKAKDRINFPIAVNASPDTFSEEKLKLLLEIGVVHIEMGIQSGSERINFEIFNRRVKNEKVLETTQIINKYIDKTILPPLYHIITRNPYEQKEDKVATLKILHDIPKPYILLSFNMQFLPGTALYKRGIADGFVKSLESVMEHIGKDIMYFHDIDTSSKIISIDDIFSVMGVVGLDTRGRYVGSKFYGLLYSNLIDNFLKRPIEDIPMELKIIIPEQVEREIINTMNTDVKISNFSYILRVVTFLTEIPSKIELKTKILKASMDNYRFTGMMLEDHYLFTNKEMLMRQQEMKHQH